MPSHDVAALLAELGQMQSDRKMSGGVWVGVNPMKTTRAGGTVYVAMCPNGYHESAESEAHALFLLVDSFRTRDEDRPETHAAIQAWGGSYSDIRVARAEAMRLAREVREKHTNASDAERGDMLRADIAKQAADLKTPKKQPDPKPPHRRKP